MESSKDEGWSWVVLVGVFGTSILGYGFIQSIGVFFVDWQEDFGASAQEVGWTSALSLSGFGISGLVSSVISPYVSCRRQASAGSFLNSVALSCAPFCTHISHVYVIMILSGFGIGLAFSNAVVVLAYYFDKKLALANGVGLSGAAAGVLILAPAIRYLNNEYSWRGSMLIIGGMMGNMFVCASLFRVSRTEAISMAGIRPVVEENKNGKTHPDSEHNVMQIDSINRRVNQPSRRSAKRRSSTAVNNLRRHSRAFVQSYTNVLSIRFAIVCMGSAALLGFGYFTALLYFVSNAIDLGIPKTDAAFLLSIFGICGGIGRLCHGPIVDRNLMSPFHLGSLLLAIAGSSCLIGSFARSYAALVVFAIFLGFTASTYNVLFALIFRLVVGVNYFKKIFGVSMLVIHGTPLIALPLMGYVYDVTGDYRTSFYVAGFAMLLNSFILLMDPVWQMLDRRRLKAKQETKEMYLKETEEKDEERDEGRLEGGEKSDGDEQASRCSNKQAYVNF